MKSAKITLFFLFCFTSAFAEMVDFVKLDGYPTEPGYYLMQKKSGNFISFYSDIFCRDGMGLNRLTDSDYGFVVKDENTISYKVNMDAKHKVGYTDANRFITEFVLPEGKTTLQDGCIAYAFSDDTPSSSYVLSPEFFPMSNCILMKYQDQALVRGESNNISLYCYSDTAWTDKGYSAGGYSFAEKSEFLNSNVSFENAVTLLDTLNAIDSYIQETIFHAYDDNRHFGKITYWKMNVSAAAEIVCNDDDVFVVFPEMVRTKYSEIPSGHYYIRNRKLCLKMSDTK